MKHARRKLNMVLHAFAAGMFLFGFVMAVRAAGIADLGGDFQDLVRSVECGVTAMGGGAFLWWWRI